MDPEIRTRLEASFRTTRIISLAFIGSLLVYASIVALIQTTFQPFGGFAPSVPLDLLRPLLYLLSLVIFGVIHLLKRVLFGSERLHGQGMQGLFIALQSGHILLFALAEAPVLYGLLLFLFAGWAGDFFLLSFLALFYQLSLSPRRERWEEAARSFSRGS